MIDVDRAFPDVLDGEQPVPDRVVLDRELDAGAMDVGRPDLDPHPAAFGDGRRDLLAGVPHRRQDARHVLDGVVRLEVRGLVRDQPVAGGMRLVEAVPLERLERGEDGVDRRWRHAALRRLGHELLAHGPQHGRLLLADRIAEGVGLGAGESAEGDGRGHDVFLVDEDPVRLLEVRLQQRVEVRHRLQAVLAADVGRDVVHRARAGTGRPLPPGRTRSSGAGRGCSAASPPTPAGRCRSSRPTRGAGTSARRRGGWPRGRPPRRA